MDDPQNEIAFVIGLLCSSCSPDIQQATIAKYFTEDAGFKHPLCAVEPGPNSRTQLLGIYQWYKVMSPDIDIRINQVLYDRQENVLVCDGVQKFHIRISPFSVAPARIIVKVHLRKIDGKHYIAFQEDFYHPEDLIALILPPLRPLVRWVHWGATLVSNVNARVASMIGVWSPTEPLEKSNKDSSTS